MELKKKIVQTMYASKDHPLVKTDFSKKLNSEIDRLRIDRLLKKISEIDRLGLFNHFPKMN